MKRKSEHEEERDSASVAFLSLQAVEMLLQNLLPHELEAVMARTIKLAKVVLVESPRDDSCVPPCRTDLCCF